MSWAAPATAAGIQQAFLVQNSGWMEPFYTDPASQLKPLVAAVAAAATSPDDTVFTLAFSQSSGSHASPQLLASSRGAADMARQLAPLAVARKGSGGALADTDFKEAITGTITGPFKAAPGILWIFTNNKNSPNNDAQTAERNRDFYRLLHLEPSITKTLVFPLKMPVRGKLYAAQGLMVYALAYGQPAAAALDRIMAEGRLSKVLTNAPARLKPVDQGAARLLPERVMNAPNVRVSLASDNTTLVLDVDAADLVPTVTLQASLENLFYPYVIRQAKVQAALGLGAGRTPIAVAPAAIEGLEPGARQSVEVSFTLPMAQVPSPWSAQALAAMGKQIVLPMVVEMALTDQQLVPSAAFTAQLRELFPGDPISEMFTPPDSVRASQTQVPLQVRIQYPLAPVLALMGGVLLLVGSMVAGLVLARSSKRYEVLVDGVRRSFVLKPFSTLPVVDGDGNPVGELKRGLGRPQVLRVAEGRSLSVTGR
ncbi:hypothetical protein CKO37_17945 [Rubrivivax gelatinosus]|nr:hypothetical protein [Rubrivivax gelatinosus]